MTYSTAEACFERGCEASAFGDSQSMQGCDMLQGYPTPEGMHTNIVQL